LSVYFYTGAVDRRKSKITMNEKALTRTAIAPVLARALFVSFIIPFPLTALRKTHGDKENHQGYNC
jgi:hypothetical protein